jgi:hypothetical protein
MVTSNIAYQTFHSRKNFANTESVKRHWRKWPVGICASWGRSGVSRTDGDGNGHGYIHSNSDADSNFNSYCHAYDFTDTHTYATKAYTDSAVSSYPGTAFYHSIRPSSLALVAAVSQLCTRPRNMIQTQLQ